MASFKFNNVYLKDTYTLATNKVIVIDNFIVVGNMT